MPPTASAASAAAAVSASQKLFGVVGKNVLVTGGSRGIGLMIAKGFVSHGANVFLTSRDEKACKEAAESIMLEHKDRPHCCRYIASNVSTREGCRELTSHVQEVFQGRLDVLVNNAGTSWGEPLERESGKANWGWDKVLDLNVKGMFYLTRECLPMLEQSAAAADRNGDGGIINPARVINIGSVAGILPQLTPTHAYDVSKAAVHHLTKKFAADFASKNITVNAVAPGFVPSRMSDGLATWGITPDVIASAIPLGRMGSDEDMAGACIYFASRAGAWCTGVVLNVDGGAVGCTQLNSQSNL